MRKKAQWFKAVLKSLLATIILLCLLEAGAWLAGWPQGASHFAEAIVIRSGISLKKPRDEIRIFAYGESTMQGSHYGEISNPARWLESYLGDLLPGKRIRVLNFSRVGRGSDFTWRTFRDTVQYEPDIALFYLGHNEFFPGQRRDEILLKSREPEEILREAIQKSRFLSGVWRYVIRYRMKRHENRSRGEEPGLDVIEAPLHTGPREAYFTPRSEPFYLKNVGFFRSNIMKMVRLGRDHETNMLFFVPVSNIRNFPPNASLHMKELDSQQLALWEKHFEEGRRLQSRGLWQQARDEYEKAYSIDFSFAELSYRLGEVTAELGDLERAGRYFMEARDNDVLVFRATREIMSVIRELPVNDELAVLETDRLILGETDGGIPGFPIIEDNVHFSVHGHAVLARALAREIAKREWIAMPDAWGWENEKDEAAMKEEMGMTPELLFEACLKMVHYSGRWFEHRIRYARKALEILPGDPRALRALAWSYWLQKDTESAIAVYREIEDRYPDVFEEILQAHPEIGQVGVRKPALAA